MRGLFDIHCHLVPYVDDGARDMDEAIKMLKMEYSTGGPLYYCDPPFSSRHV